ncbi:MAG TPA: lipopolysaccharide heptosyltransferase II [Kiritimatiellia bacterium]|nr:lipopolysaccharide heptosyltransferase II [Kiritimatiellia bacterium]HMP34980.1 lipopolysaccharide heptosyltransferase II [Kiritimatiellia bacterium]
MSGSTASASADPAARELVVSVNWIGDAIMAIPAVQETLRRRPDLRLSVLARGGLAALWRLFDGPIDVIGYQGRPGLHHPVFNDLRQRRFSRAWILPNSFRTAWIATRAGIPVRTGFGRGLQFPLINDRRGVSSSPDRRHQAWEYLELMDPDPSRAAIPFPRLAVPAAAAAATWTRLGAWSDPVIGMIPGAARGPSKRWPPEHFIATARRFAAAGCRIALFGGPDDQPVCSTIAAALGPAALDYAGRTSLAEWATLLSACALVVANDSGGMHLAAALDRPVVALYGMTDPDRTGPLGRRCTILQRGGPRARDIPRDSTEARARLAAISPDEVIAAARALGLPVEVT